LSYLAHFCEVFCVQYRLEGNSTNYKLALLYIFRAYDSKPTKCKTCSLIVYIIISHFIFLHFF